MFTEYESMIESYIQMPHYIIKPQVQAVGLFAETQTKNCTFGHLG